MPFSIPLVYNLKVRLQPLLCALRRVDTNPTYPLAIVAAAANAPAAIAKALVPPPDNKEQIKVTTFIAVGAAIYGYSSSKYGHVGIYIGNGMVAHNIGYIKIEPIEDWIKTYKGFAWGWENNMSLV